MADANTDFGRVADDLRRAASAFALLTSSATAFGSALNQFRQFEKQLILTNAIAGGTVKQFNAMESAARQFSLATTVTATEAAGALQNLAQAGFTAEESLQSMSGVLLLAQATFVDIAIASDLLTSSIRAFKLEATDTSRVSNVLAASVTSSLATIDKLAFAMRQVAPVAELANLSIEETAALLNQLFNVGLRGEQAGTALRNIIIRLVRPLGEASDILREYGIATNDAAGELLPLVEILQQLKDKGVSNAELARIFETEALAGVVALMDATSAGLDGATSAYQRNLEAITDTDRALELAVENLGSLDGQLKLTQNAINDVQKDLGKALAPAIILIGETIRDLIEAFRNLSPETQRLLANTGAIAAGFAVLLASVNAIALLFGGVAFSAVTRFGAALFGAEKAIGGTVRQAGLLRKAVAGLGGIVARATAAFAAWIPALSGVARAAVALTPQGRIIVGLITLAGLLASTAVAWKNWGDEGKAAIDKIRFDNISGSKANALSLADDIVPESEVTELQARVDAINEQLEVAQLIQSPRDNIDTTRRITGKSSALLEEAEENLALLDEEFEGIQDLLARRQEYLEKIAELRATTEQGKYSTVAEYLNDTVFFKDTINTFYDNLDAETAGILQAYDERSGPAEDALESARQAVETAQKQNSESIRRFLDQVVDREENELGDEFALYEDRVADALGNRDIFNRVAEILQEQGDFSAIDVIVQSLKSLNDPAVNQLITDLLNTRRKELISGISLAAQAAQAGLEADAEALRIELLEYEADNSTVMAEAVGAATEAGLAQLAVDLDELTGDLEGSAQEIFQDFKQFNSAAFNEAVNAAFDGSGFDLSGASIGDVFGGQALMDAIYAEVDADTTTEEFNAIAQQKFEEYSTAVNNLVNTIIASLQLNPDQVKALQDSAASVLEIIEATIDAGLKGVESNVAATTKRVKTANKPKRGGGGGGKSADQLAKEALRDARKIEDAFRDAEKEVLNAKQTFAENAFGILPAARTADLLGLDIEAIEQDFDRKITRLKRKLEDLNLDFTGSPEQQAQLKAQTEQAIELIEKAKQAEIDAATSFEAQMDRRSESLDLFIRDLETLAFESQDTFTKVAAGIGAAFAEYQKDLVTLVDITRDAVTGYLDTITTGISDFIFDNENAWETFKKSMLDISKQIFEGFTKGLMQQAISSLTGGGGSIFGNALQPSRGDVGGGNAETPGIGGGGFLGKLFGGLGGGGQQGGAGANAGAAQIQQGTQAVATALQQGAVQIQQAMTQVGSQTRAGGAQVNSGFQQGSQQVRQGGQDTGSALNETASTVRSANQQIAASASAGGSGGGAGGGGFLTSLFSTALSFFADGGYVQAKKINTGVTGKQMRSIMKAYADGGKITGPGSGTSDDILAFLSNGEFVSTAKTTKQFQPVLEALNAGDTGQAIVRLLQSANNNRSPNVPAYAQGGLVVGGNYVGPPSVNLTEPRAVLIDSGAGNTSSNNTVNNRRGGDTIVNIHMSYTNNGKADDRSARRSADQMAKRVGMQIQRSKKNT